MSTARWQSRGARRGEGRAAQASATGGVARGFTPRSASATSAHKHGHVHWRTLARARATGCACCKLHSSYLGVAVLKSPCSLMQGVGTWSDSHFAQGAAQSHFAQGAAQNRMLLCVVQDQDHLNQAQGRAWSWTSTSGGWDRPPPLLLLQGPLSPGPTSSGPTSSPVAAGPESRYEI